jgi:hypothetical protein
MLWVLLQILDNTRSRVPTDPSDSVSLIYLDPPFLTNRNYAVILSNYNKEDYLSGSFVTHLRKT